MKREQKRPPRETFSWQLWLIDNREPRLMIRGFRHITAEELHNKRNPAAKYFI